MDEPNRMTFPSGSVTDPSCFAVVLVPGAVHFEPGRSQLRRHPVNVLAVYVEIAVTRRFSLGGFARWIVRFRSR
jgi:hypothetical protein